MRWIVGVYIGETLQDATVQAWILKSKRRISGKVFVARGYQVITYSAAVVVVG